MFKSLFSILFAMLFVLFMSNASFAHPGHGCPVPHTHDQLWADQPAAPVMTSSGSPHFQMPRPVKMATPDVAWNPHAYNHGGLGESLLQLVISGLLLVFLLPVCTGERVNIARNDAVRTVVAAVLILMGFTVVQWLTAIFVLVGVVGSLVAAPSMVLLAPIVYFGACILGWAAVLCFMSRVMPSTVRVASYGWAMCGALVMMLLEWTVAVML